MLPIVLPLLVLPLLFFLYADNCRAAQITDYRVIRRAVVAADRSMRVAIRSFREDGVEHLLVVDPATFESYDLPAAGCTLAGPAADAALASTRYLSALQRHTSAPYPLQNDGATRADHDLAGNFLTVDLCPSRRPFEREMFEAVGQSGRGKPVPVTVAASGVWLAKHPDEIAFLKREVAAGRLAITWMNHSYHHPYEPGVPLERNFLITPGTDFAAEVLDLERELLAHGLVPSPFFRFPGLVSDQATVKKLEEMSLIPIGADAWLAKGESPRRGSFILVHGNGNEPKGIKLLMPMLRNRELHLLPLADAFR